MEGGETMMKRALKKYAQFFIGTIIGFLPAIIVLRGEANFMPLIWLNVLGFVTTLCCEYYKQRKN